MKPLNRPMFRYGGPIKEGVMSGIREPHKNGNIVGGHQSPKLAGAHPWKDASGREHHVVPAGIAVGAGLNALRHGAMRYGARLLPKLKNIFGSTTPATVTRGGKPVADAVGSYTPVTINPAKFNPNWLGRDPIVKTIGATGKAIFNPTVGGWAGKAARFATSPSSIIAGVAYYLWPDGKERKTPPPKGDIKISGRVGTSGAPGGGHPGMYLEPQTKKGGGVELTAEELRKKNVERYRDIMDIKGMNKKAAYNSLIEASRLINESGDFKGDIKSGKLINQIIQGASKAYDKPSQTKDAIDTLILKGEIEKDLNKEKNELANKVKRKQLEVYDKQLAGDTFEEIVSARMVKGDMLQGSELASLLRIKKGVDAKVLPSTGIKPDQDALEFAQAQILAVNNDPETPNYPAGVYVIRDRIIQVDEQGNVSKLL